MSNQVTIASLATVILIGLLFVFAIPVIRALATCVTISALVAANSALIGLMGIIAAAISALAFWTLQGHVNTLFGDQWPYGYFWVVYTVNFYFWCLATSMSVWGPLHDGSTYTVWSFTAFPKEFNAGVFIYYWEQFANEYGQNNWASVASPDWTSVDGRVAIGWEYERYLAK